MMRLKNLKDSKIVHILYYDSDNICNSYLDSLCRKDLKYTNTTTLYLVLIDLFHNLELKKFSLEITSILALQENFYVKEKHFNKLGLHYENKIKFSNEDLKKLKNFSNHME